MRQVIYYILISMGVMLFFPFWLLKSKRRKRPQWPCLRLGFKSGHMAGLPQGGIWIHALSVGEVNSALPLVRALSTIYPVVYLSTATYTGYKLAQKEAGSLCHVLVRPLDVPWAVSRWLAALKPAMFILVESDMWPAWQYAIKKTGIFCALVNARVSPRTMAGYKKCPPLARLLYKDFDLITVQSPLDKERLDELGIKGGKVLGNLKFDSLPQPLNEPDKERLAGELGLPYGSGFKMLLAGSTHQGEEEACIAAWERLCQKGHEDLFLMLAPRDITRAAQIADMLPPDQAWRFSQGPLPADKKVLILDVMGKLAASYALASAAFIGGSLVAEGGHNPLEAAIQRVPVVFGPHMEDFAQMADELVELQAADRIANPAQLLPAWDFLLSDRPHARQKGSAGQSFCLRHQGACERIMALLPNVLKSMKHDHMA